MLSFITFSYKDSFLHNTDTNKQLKDNTSQAVNAKLGHINRLVENLNLEIFTPAAVTQTTNSSTGVTINSRTGVITTVSLTTGSGNTETFTVTNSKVLAGSSIVATVNKNGSNGDFAVSVDNVADGSFDVIVKNVHSGQSANDAIKINFIVL